MSSVMGNACKPRCRRLLFVTLVFLVQRTMGATFMVSLPLESAGWGIGSTKRARAAGACGSAETPMNQIESQSLANQSSRSTPSPSASKSGRTELRHEEWSDRAFHFFTGTRTWGDVNPIGERNLLTRRTVLEGAIIIFLSTGTKLA
jgi:hypothetical protein